MLRDGILVDFYWRRLHYCIFTTLKLRNCRKNDKSLIFSLKNKNLPHMECCNTLFTFRKHLIKKYLAALLILPSFISIQMVRAFIKPSPTKAEAINTISLFSCSFVLLLFSSFQGVETHLPFDCCYKNTIHTCLCLLDVFFRFRSLHSLMWFWRLL